MTLTADGAPTFLFEDTLSPADCKRYIALPFDVPPGMAELRIDFMYDPLHVEFPQGIGNLLSLGLYDPAGFRGNMHNGSNRNTVEIGPCAATPGFSAGPLLPGRWVLEVQTHLVLPGAPLNYRAEIRLAEGSGAVEPARLPSFPWQPPLRRGPGWFRGDLHTHTRHSDGKDTVASLLQTARAYGLDFVALTDHNTVTALYDPMLQGYRDLLVIPGMELTTYYGHALALGTTRWFDWRTGSRRRTMGQALEEIHAAGGLSVLAHLAALGDPACTGCAWLYTDQMPGIVNAMEVWNGPWFEVGTNSPNTLHIYYEWLSRGHRLPATAGTDTHGPEQYARCPAFNVVYATELSAPAILSGVRAGHVMLSTGPRVYLEAALSNGEIAIMGDVVAAQEVRQLTLRTPEAPAGARVRWVVEGEPAAEWSASEEVFSPSCPDGARWALAELRAADGAMLALTNPIYLK